jgi:hypothetical protein
MDKSLTERIGLYMESLPPPTGRTFHQMQPETLLSECRTMIELQAGVIISYQNQIAVLEKALKKIAAIEDEHINVPKTNEGANLWACLAMCVELAEAALGEKADGQD